MKKTVLKKCITEICGCCKAFNQAYLCDGDVTYWESRLDGILFVLQMAAVSVQFFRTCPNSLYSGVEVEGVYFDIQFENFE